MKIKEDDVVLCTVTKIEGTAIFCDLEEGGHGTIVLSEVAAGRIRNLREYVNVGKKVVCKVLAIEKDHVELSLRRVTAKERVGVLERYKKERAFANVLSIVKIDAKEVLAAIKTEQDIGEFFDELREKPTILEKYLPRDVAAKVAQMVAEKETRSKLATGNFRLFSGGENGVEDIKEILDVKGGEIHYLGSSVFSLSVSERDFKQAQAKFDFVLAEIKKRAEKKGAGFEIVKGK